MPLSNLRSVLYSVKGRVATITLNRPSRLNVIEEIISRAIQAANNDDAVHAIVVTGAGRSFCSGYDLKDLSEGEKVGPNKLINRCLGTQRWTTN